MPSIGGTTCTFIHTQAGRPPAAMRQEVDVWRMAGVNGYGAMWLGQGGGEFQFAAVLYTNAAGVTTWETALQAMQGTIVTIVDDLAKSHTNCLLLHVGNARTSAARNAGGTVTQRAELDIAGLKVGS